MANEVKESKKVKREKKAFYKRWWFKAFVIILVLSALTSNNDSNVPEAPEAPEMAPSTEMVEITDPVVIETQREAGDLEEELEETEEAFNQFDAEVMCKVLMERFVEDILCEDWHWTQTFEMDTSGIGEDGNGTIEVLYFPNKAGIGETKVNMTIEKNGSTYTITYILLAGLYEVDMHTVPDRYLSIVD